MQVPWCHPNEVENSDNQQFLQVFVHFQTDEALNPQELKKSLKQDLDYKILKCLLWSVGGRLKYMLSAREQKMLISILLPLD